MRYQPPLITLLVLLAVSLAFACGSGGDDGDTITVSSVGDGFSGAFVTDVAFDVRVVGDNVTVDNSRLIVYQLTPHENGFRTAIVTGSGPKAVAEGVTQRPGPILDLTFDIGQGEYYVLLKTDSTNVWTMTVKGVFSPP